MALTMCGSLADISEEIEVKFQGFCGSNKHPWIVIIEDDSSSNPAPALSAAEVI